MDSPYKAFQAGSDESIISVYRSRSILIGDYVESNPFEYFFLMILTGDPACDRLKQRVLRDWFISRRGFPVHDSFTEHSIFSLPFIESRRYYNYNIRINVFQSVKVSIIER